MYNSGGYLFFYLNDHLGSARLVIDTAGTVKDKYYTSAFGAPTGQTVNLNQRYRYTGKPFDEDGGIDLYYYGARYYDPMLGRFLAIDPLASKYPGWSPYVYTLDNPYRYVDPEGEAVWFIIAAAVAIVIAFDEYGNTPTSETDIYNKTAGERFTDAVEAILYIEGARMLSGVVGATERSGLTAARGRPKPSYSEVPSPRGAGPGKSFTQLQKQRIKAANRQANAGELRSDISGKKLCEPRKHQKDVSPPKNEAHVHHIEPKSKGGTNRSSNAQVISRQENLSISDKYPE